MWCVLDVSIFHFGQFFALFPPNSPKNQNFKKNEKKTGDIIIYLTCTKNHDHMLYCSWDMAHDRCNCYFSFWAIFCPFTPLTAQKTKIKKKKEKNSWRYHFTHVRQDVWSDDVEFLRYGARQMDRQTDRWLDRWKKWNIEVGARPKKVKFKGSSFPKLLLDNFCSKICC